MPQLGELTAVGDGDRDDYFVQGALDAEAHANGAPSAPIEDDYYSALDYYVGKRLRAASSVGSLVARGIEYSHN